MAFNRKANKTAEEIASAEILDSDEQDAIVRDLEREANEQDSALRTVSCFTFRGIAALFALLFLYSAYMPMSMDHQSVFQDIVPHLVFQVFYIFTGLNFMNFGNFIKVNNTFYCFFNRKNYYFLHNYFFVYIILIFARKRASRTLGGTSLS